MLRTRTSCIALLIGALGTVAACGGGSSGGGSRGIHLAILSPARNATVSQPITLNMSVTGLSLVKANGNRSGKTGRLAVYVDSSPVGPGQKLARSVTDVRRTTKTKIVLGGLSPGRHRIIVIAIDGLNFRIGDAQASVTFTALAAPPHPTTTTTPGPTTTVTTTVTPATTNTGGGTTSSSAP